MDAAGVRLLVTRALIVPDLLALLFVSTWIETDKENPKLLVVWVNGAKQRLTFLAAAPTKCREALTLPGIA
jgi:hypothetical protein